jgi:hypothetical protein
MKCTRVALWLGLIAFAWTGCQSATPKLRPMNLVLNKMTPASIKVDLIGVSEVERHAWEGYDVDQYWTEGDSRRANADKLTVNLPTGQSAIIRKDDPHWQSWIQRGADQLLVIADLPGQFTPGPTDPRRIFIPLTRDAAWTAKGDSLEIQVQDTMVRALTP